MWQVAATDWVKLLQLQQPGWWTMAGATVFLIVLIWVFVRFVTSATEDVDPAEADREMLDAVNELRAQGDLSEDEFRSIKGRLMTRLGKSFEVRPRPQTLAKSAGPASELDHTTADSEVSSKQDVGPAASPSASAQSTETESFTCPTNVPESTQDTGDLSTRDGSSSSEKTSARTLSDDQHPDAVDH